MKKWSGLGLAMWLSLSPVMASTDAGVIASVTNDDPTQPAQLWLTVNELEEDQQAEIHLTLVRADSNGCHSAGRGSDFLLLGDQAVDAHVVCRSRAGEQQLRYQARSHFGKRKLAGLLTATEPTAVEVEGLRFVLEPIESGQPTDPDASATEAWAAQ
ncbi:hypothetical protein [Ferrimonas marina]|uniref:Uncharacterized protein n=1 Tax=Ferrimonas marina TaxID=299255 RepID=A0A1M5ZG26_9GAMM|nr:hypothetical protein [Ferrimonas marina]SHI23132.1 hypothetical protein SAMN02745129_0255 [Ferrimonas marina]